MGKRRPSDREICDGVVAMINARLGAALKFQSRPDESERNKKGIDFVYSGNGVVYNFEHTRIESFSGQIGYENTHVKFYSEVRRQLEGKLPKEGSYNLASEIGSLNGISRRDIPVIQSKLVDWVVNTAPNLEIGSPRTAPKHLKKGKPPGVPFEVTLYRWDGNDGRFDTSLNIPPDVEEKRAARLLTALKEKLPKLMDHTKPGEVSALLLESDDFQLANMQLVAGGLAKALQSYEGNLPDQIYLIESEWRPLVVWILKEGPKFFPHIPDSSYFEVP